MLVLSKRSSSKLREMKEANDRAGMYYIYILRSKLDKKFYTGYTSNLKRRLKEHQDGNVDSTKNRRPLELIYYEAYREKQLALNREKFLKTTKGKVQLRKQFEVR